MASRVILKGRTEFLKPIITQILAIHQLIDERDIGDFVGQPVEEYLRAKPQSIKLAIVFYSVPAPPWKPDHSTHPETGVTTLNRLVRATYNVPDVNKAELNWSTVKAACGGANGYMWGRFKCTANLDNGRQMQVHGADAETAEERLKALQLLSTSKILTVSVSEEKKEGRRAQAPALFKNPTRIYPAYFTIMNQQKVEVESNVALLAGNYYRSHARIPLWTHEEPTGTEAKILEALTVHQPKV